MPASLYSESRSWCKRKGLNRGFPEDSERWNLFFCRSPSSQVYQEDVDRLAADVKIKTAKLEAAKAENVALRTRLKEFDGIRSSQDDMIEAMKKHLEAQTSVSCGCWQTSFAACASSMMSVSVLHWIV